MLVDTRRESLGHAVGNVVFVAFVCSLYIGCEERQAEVRVARQQAALHEPMTATRQVAVPDLSSVLAVEAADSTRHDAALAARDQSDALLYGRLATATPFDARVEACEADPRVLLELVSVEACVGADLFFREAFGGNGRTCGSCHPSTNNFTIDKGFIERLAPDDPLFIAEQRHELAQLERPDLLREFGLILVNADGSDAPETNFVMRSVSHILSQSTSITPGPIFRANLTRDGSTIAPLQRTGWAGDGAPGDGTLRDFPTGAVRQHMTRSLERVAEHDFVEPTKPQLIDMARFSLTVGRQNEISLEAARLSDPGAERGRRDFLDGEAGDCNLCHENGGANHKLVLDPLLGTPFIANLNFDIGSERARLPILDQRRVPFDGGFGVAPFDSDGDGQPDSFGDGRFNTPSLIEAADTGPYFHTHAFATIEDSIEFYTSDAFNGSPVGVDGVSFKFTKDEILDLGRLLRVLNAALNCQMAMARIDAARQISNAYGDRFSSIQRGLLKLAGEELQDAARVLSGVADLNVAAKTWLSHAQRDLGRALRCGDSTERAARIAELLADATNANAALGTGMTFEIGEGTLMF